jgi:hypothetical protein
MTMESRTMDIMNQSDAGTAVAASTTDPKGQSDCASSVGVPAFPNGRCIVFDIEIAKPIPLLPDGYPDWEFARKGGCGVGCVVLYDYRTERYHLYDNTMLGACIDHLNSADYIISYNGDRFDIPVLEATSGRPLTAKSFDLLHLIWDAIGESDFHKGYGLGNVAWRTLGLEKSGSGENAPILIQQGRWAECLDYCLNDVYLTKKVLEAVGETGCIIDINGEDLKISEAKC